MKEKFILPKIFYIYSKNLEENNVVAAWFNSKYQPGRFTHTTEGEYFTPNVDKLGLYGSSTMPNRLPIITFEQFQEYVLKPIKVKKENYNYLIPIFKKLKIK